VRLAKVFVSLSLLSMMLFGAEDDPFLAKWRLNWEKSHSSQPQPKSVTRSYRKSGNGVRVQETWVDASGKKNSLDYVASYDGHDYPVRTAKSDTVAFTRSDRNTVEGVSKKDGKVAYTFKRRVSPDGRTLTVELTTTDPAGKATTEVLVYDKVM
jgi:hypothetical protein